MPLVAGMMSASSTSPSTVESHEHSVIQPGGSTQIDKTNVLIGRMRAISPVGGIAGRRESRHPHHSAQSAQKRQRSAANRRDLHLLAAARFYQPNYLLDQRLLQGSDFGPAVGPGGNNDIAVPPGLQMGAELGDNVVGVLVRNEAEVDLGDGVCREDGLGACATVAASEASDIAGR